MSGMSLSGWDNGAFPHAVVGVAGHDVNFVYKASCGLVIRIINT